MAVSVTAIFAVLVPIIAGVSVTVMVQLLPLASVLGPTGQLPIAAVFRVKSLAFVPVTRTLEIVKGPLMLLVSVAVIDALAVPEPTEPKSRLLGDALASAMVGTTPAAPVYNPV